MTAKEAMHYYAIISTHNCVIDVFTSELDAGAPLVQFEGERRAARHTGARWVYVDGRCLVGETLDVDSDGCATVRDC